MDRIQQMHFELTGESLPDVETRLMLSLGRHVTISHDPKSQVTSYEFLPPAPTIEQMAAGARSRLSARSSARQTQEHTK